MAEETRNPDTFRAELREWLEANCPPSLRDGNNSMEAVCWGGRNWQFASEDQKLWLDRCVARGLTVPTWPRDYGGAGLSREEEKIFHDEMARINARYPLQSFGIWMLGPALLQFGTEAQKQHYLPPIARGEIRWCQGYSEPGAGSDLASVQTKCEDKGDHWLVNGQKIWTSYADKADAIFALVRSDREAAKHLGITFLLIDMDRPGVSTRPIKLISGMSPFCETFFDDVVVPKTDAGGIPAVVGEVNRGWDVATYLLTHDRTMISGMGGSAARPLGAVLQDDLGGVMDAVTRAAALKAEIDGLAFALTAERYKDMAEAGQGVGHASAMLKYVGTELNKDRHELLMSAGGSDALDWDGAFEARPADWLRTKANSIEGGTSEVMLGIVARRVLGLPG